MYLILCIVLVTQLISGAYVGAEYLLILLTDLAVFRAFIHESFANFIINDVIFNYSYLIDSMKLCGLVYVHYWTYSLFSLFPFAVFFHFVGIRDEVNVQSTPMGMHCTTFCVKSL